jgi:NAD(P)-dependent dehydrogenase (short-subunit alcohol dehydrogenase family)
VTDEGSIRAALERTGELDAIVNNAALHGKGPLETFPLDRIRAMFETNALGALAVLQQVLPAWRDRGHGVVVNISSVEGRVGAPLDGAYSATKFALEAVSESLHYELGHFGIRVVIIEPGYIAPGMKRANVERGHPAYQTLWDEWDRSTELLTGPEGRPGPEVVAVAIRKAIEDPATPLRVPVGDDAVMVLGARAQLDDATFEAAMRQTVGLTW